MKRAEGLRVRFALFLLGKYNCDALYQIMEVVCGTRKSYNVKTCAPILDVLMRRWLDNNDDWKRTK